jgi:hypothetical protein
LGGDGVGPPMLACPFCGAAETDRFDLEGKRFVVFGCMFTPEIDPGWPEADLAARLESAYRAEPSGAYFRRMCDRLHLYVTAGPGGRALRGGTAPGPGDDGRPSTPT